MIIIFCWEFSLISHSMVCSRHILCFLCSELRICPGAQFPVTGDRHSQINPDCWKCSLLQVATDVRPKWFVKIHVNTEKIGMGIKSTLENYDAYLWHHIWYHSFYFMSHKLVFSVIPEFIFNLIFRQHSKSSFISTMMQAQLWNWCHFLIL